MKDVRVYVCFCVLLAISSVSTDEDFDKFKLWWPNEKDLKCIHTKVQDVGLNPTPRPGDPSYAGLRTSCVFLAGDVLRVHSNKWPSTEELLAVFFLRGKPPHPPMFKEGDAIEECETMSDIDTTPQPEWLRSNDTESLENQLKTHCFFKNADGNVSFKYVYKMSFGLDASNKNNFFQSELVLYLVANRSDYYIANSEDELEKLCTRCISSEEAKPRTSFKDRYILNTKGQFEKKTLIFGYGGYAAGGYRGGRYRRGAGGYRRGGGGYSGGRNRGGGGRYSGGRNRGGGGRYSGGWNRGGQGFGAVSQRRWGKGYDGKGVLQKTIRRYNG